MALKGKQGGSTGSVEYSASRLKRIAARRAAEERRWAARQPTGRPFVGDRGYVETAAASSPDAAPEDD